VKVFVRWGRCPCTSDIMANSIDYTRPSYRQTHGNYCSITC